MRPLPTILILSLLVAAPGVSIGGQMAQFTDGRVLEVETADRDEGQGVLTLVGGGEIRIPSDRISNWDELSDEPVTRAEKIESVEVDDLWEARGRWREAAGEYAEYIHTAAERHNLDPALLTAVMEVESAFNPTAVSPKGARGLLQLMPATARRFGVRDSFDPQQNVDGGARYLSWLMDRFEGRTELALAGYNAGEGAVDRHDGIPPYAETRHYVTLVLRGAGRLGAQSGPAAP